MPHCRLLSSLFALIPAALVAGGCSVELGQHEPSPAPLDTVALEVGAEGGVLEAACGRLSIPGGAFQGRTRVTLRSVMERPAGPLQALGASCQLDLGASPSKPLLLALRYDVTALEASVPPTLIAVGRVANSSGWAPVWMPTLPANGLVPTTVTAGGSYVAALALANTSACVAGASYCAFLGGPAPAKKAPAGWVPIPGTNGGQYELDALFKYFDNPGYLSEGLCAVNLACSAEPLSSETRLAIRVECEKLPCPYDLVCAAKKVNEELSKGSDNVCRHYAWAMREAAAVLGYSANFECGWYDGVGHAWVKVDCGGRTYLLDAFAQTYVSTSGPVPVACGNDVVEAGEQCDGKGGACASGSECVSCQCVAKCGNGKLDAGEQCDGAGNGCASGQLCQSCQCVPAPVCGNELLEPGEDCESWAPCPSGKTCTASCKCEPLPAPACGNGELETGEQCETDAQCDSGSTCQSCQCVAKCGNGQLDAGEQCDGAAGTCGAANECVQCQCLPKCGNGKVDAGEQCDGVGPAQCTTPGDACYKCQCQPFVQCAGLPSKDMCLACCEGAAISQAEFATCASTNCTKS
jgi:hypothetical protein